MLIIDRLAYTNKFSESNPYIKVWCSKLIFFDEPTAGLDYLSRENIKSIINNISNEGKTIVISSHDMNFIYEICDYIYVLNKGQVLAEGEIQEVFLKKAILDKASLEEPFLIKAYKYLDKPLCKSEKELFSYKRKMQ